MAAGEEIREENPENSFFTSFFVLFILHSLKYIQMMEIRDNITSTTNKNNHYNINKKSKNVMDINVLQLHSSFIHLL